MSLVSFVFQEAYLFQGTVMDNIRLGKPDATDEDVIAAALRAGCHTFIEQLPQGYHTAVGNPDNERYIQEAFEELARDKTVVIIAHRLHTVRRANHIVVIEDGRVVQSGTHKELLAHGGVYRRFWEERRRAQ